MILKFICCDVFCRIACQLAATSPHIVDVEFLPMLVYVDPDALRKQLQEKIDSAINSGRVYDAIILGYGLCGNSVVGLTSDVPMVIMRAHDCCTVHMGSKESFLEAFGNSLSSAWSSTGSYERAYMQSGGYSLLEQEPNYKSTQEYISYLEQYGEEDADYIWDSLHPKIDSSETFYIKIDGFEYSNAYESYSALSKSNGKQCKAVYGDISMLKALVYGQWQDSRLLVIKPGQKIAGVYDMNEVMKAE
ncbi:MAG: DUF1638 domain-containing protein [Eubacteriaceae bacterium]|nr:DUF1638 domain-containing protein [Eubacteriaceae bacterium]